MLEPLPQHGIVPTKEEYIGMFVYFNILNVIAEGQHPVEGPDFLKQWRESVNSPKNVLAQFQHAINQIVEGLFRSKLQCIHDVIELMVSLTHFDNNGIFYIDIFEEKDDIVQLLNQEILNKFYLQCI